MTSAGGGGSWRDNELPLKLVKRGDEFGWGTTDSNEGGMIWSGEQRTQMKGGMIWTGGQRTQMKQGMRSKNAEQDLLDGLSPRLWAWLAATPSVVVGVAGREEGVELVPPPPYRPADMLYRAENRTYT